MKIVSHCRPALRRQKLVQDLVICHHILTAVFVNGADGFIPGHIIHKKLIPPGIQRLHKGPAASESPTLRPILLHALGAFLAVGLIIVMDPAKHPHHGFADPLLFLPSQSQKAVFWNGFPVPVIDFLGRKDQKICGKGRGVPPFPRSFGQFPGQVHKAFIPALQDRGYEHVGEPEILLPVRGAGSGCPAVYVLHGAGPLACHG